MKKELTSDSYEGRLYAFAPEEEEETAASPVLLEHEKEEEGEEPETGFALDLVHTYLQQIGKTPLLSREEETEAAKTMRTARTALRRMERAGRKHSGEIRRLHRTYDEARQLLINGNLRLVVSIAKKFYANQSLSLLDLIQEGNLGLMKAAERFDHRLGYRFSTYATWWIRQTISRAIANQSRTIRIPVHLTESLRKVLRAGKPPAGEKSREPTSGEIAQRVGLSARKVETILQAAQSPLSLQAPIGQDGRSELGNILQDTEAVSPLEEISRQMLHEGMVTALQGLPEKSRRILELRYGLYDGTPKTLQEVGEILSLSRQRVLQIEEKTLRKLRFQPQVYQMKEWA